jgi:predicted transcriptional regulator
VTGDTLGRLTLFYNRNNKHTITIHVIYDAYGFQVRYADSTNMNHEKVDEKSTAIHPNHNRWINNLTKEILAAMKEVNAARARAELIRALKSPSPTLPPTKEQP